MTIIVSIVCEAMVELMVANMTQGMAKNRENKSFTTLTDLFYSVVDDYDDNCYGEGSEIETDWKGNSHPETSAKSKEKAQEQWFAGIRALETLLLKRRENADIGSPGLIFSGPAPILSHPQLLRDFASIIFTTSPRRNLALMPRKLPGEPQKACNDPLPNWSGQVPLEGQDPLTGERFALVFTLEYSLLLVLGKDDQGWYKFNYSFDPEVTWEAWRRLQCRLSPQFQEKQQLEVLLEQFAAVAPDYRIVTQFSHHLLHHLSSSDLSKSQGVHKGAKVVSIRSQNVKRQGDSLSAFEDLELLQALTHEIRTPLTSIRTMTRLLLHKGKLPEQVKKRLQLIDQECTEQINRMELIFRAAEFKTTNDQPQQVQLVSVALEQVLKQNIPLWKKQAQRRNVDLEVILPQKLPQVVSDPAMLTQMLTGLMEKFTRSVPSGGNIRVQISTAGHQLKLQLHARSCANHNPLKALGQLLMFQPETGSLCLNTDVTKHLFNALGGKMTVKQRSQQEEVLTVFLPLGNTSQSSKVTDVESRKLN